MSESLTAALVEVERFVGRSGWDQPARLFALVRTAELIAAEPGLAEHLTNAPGDGFTSIEQEEFTAGADLDETLARIAWPDTVAGCALCLERVFVPPEVEPELPEDPVAAAAVVADHPKRIDLRVVVGVTRDGARHGVARVRGHEGELLGGTDLVPALTEALSRTLE
ncbi:MAG: PPA1309 family protein [Propionicimonas sp.]|uniref:PPA1309 family protein n=1 Tax=Propionicimonas sp. TaxID=1955623 RepID=UPI002B1F3483|nr:PPA1309 family protein [Propionicimonas sp.]MEA4944139.1 PPA1309 family protein [Propionicimonas sp.]MEA5055724.1 PPA1309 family protein [Propionicimonas sp.]MEA5117421.1 PPA1309 family protein [Propionicimonas sp.]